MATTLANRFDLAPPDGAHCGEYRIVFAKRSGITNGLNRNFIIFEAQLPNPTPSQGRLGCLPVVQFWLDQSDPAKSPATRAAELRDFYFDGLSGFEPVVHIDHYGPEGGQIRTNEFVRPGGLPLSSWTLRQFETAHAGPTGGWLLVVPSFVSDNRAGKLFTSASGDPRVTSFQGTFFPGVVERLAAADDIDRFAYGAAVPSEHEAGESLMIPLHNNYLNKFTTAPTAFRNSIQAKLTAMGSSLTPEQLVGLTIGNKVTVDLFVSPEQPSPSWGQGEVVNGEAAPLLRDAGRNVVGQHVHPPCRPARAARRRSRAPRRPR
ncbi:hypothetical protein [Sorangium sp. So ce362]|uniref:hypothetical protein n=1 Tax=Sorangium sp. So ce362 TaxID=3133303 RepID=UPI003F5F6057